MQVSGHKADLSVDHASYVPTRQTDVDNLRYYKDKNHSDLPPLNISTFFILSFSIYENGP